MEFWTVFWTCLLAGAVLVFAVLAVFVTIGGFRDLKRLFRALDEEAES